jgi:hypothetical protein
MLGVPDVLRPNGYAGNADEAIGDDMADELLHREITDRILNAFYKVYNALGYGFLERVAYTRTRWRLSCVKWDFRLNDNGR